MRRTQVLAFIMALLLCAPLATGANRVSQLAEKLESHDDFRVRTQAALALGETRSKSAVRPLCKGLDDRSASVRAASAAALQRLSKGGKDCLASRLKKERNAAVKRAIKRAMDSSEAGGGGSSPTITAKTKYYLAIGKVTNKSGRANKDVEAAVRKSMERAARGLPAYALAPQGEKPGKARQVLAKHKNVQGFYLAPKIKKPKYKDGKLIVKIEVAIFTYPDKALKGTIPVKLTQQGVSSEDPTSEMELIKMAAERAIEKLVDSADRIQ